MKSILRLFAYAVLLAIFGYGCYPNENDLSYEDLDVAITYQDESFDFSTINSVWLLDTVVHVVGMGEDKPTAAGTYDALILSTIQENLDQSIFAGKYEVVSDTSNLPADSPDLVIAVSAMETDYYYYYSYPWWGYWGYWGWDWGWYYKTASKKMTGTTQSYMYYDPWYPWYPAGGVSYGYTTGSVNIDFIIYADANLEEQYLPVAWTGIINGLRSNNSRDEHTRIVNQIEQCFSEEQSPYFHE